MYDLWEGTKNTKNKTMFAPGPKAPEPSVLNLSFVHTRMFVAALLTKKSWVTLTLDPCSTAPKWKTKCPQQRNR